ncbi:MAG: response regulator transcription factor [Bdellovibrionales bacterium]|nr:response regulator transcription factor [Bdellovibrionales bacterium]
MSGLPVQSVVANQTILIVEDETDVRDLIAVHLKRAGHVVTAVSSVEEARGAIAAFQAGAASVVSVATPPSTQHQFDLVILDWMLPGTSGVEFARELRKKNGREPAILMLTAKSEPEDVVEGLDAGADDYLTKPFEPSVLVARVRALSRRLRSGAVQAAGAIVSEPVSKSGAGFEVIRLGGLALYPETYEVKCCDEPIALTPSEFKLLLALAKSKGRVLTRDSLIAQVQGDGVSVVGRTVDTHVFGLRKKLGDCADVIETVRGVGYRVKPDSEG